jgi:transcriptional regulator with XRE-family HTH domain
MYPSIAELAREIGLKRGNLSILLAGKSKITRLMANRIESKLNLPLGSLSKEVPIINTTTITMNYFKLMKNVDNSVFDNRICIPNVITDSLEITSNSIMITHMNDNFMYPTININDMLIIDKEQTNIESNQIYLIKHCDAFRVRRLNKVKDDLEIHIDNSQCKPTYINNTINQSELEVIGKVVGLISRLD